MKVEDPARETWRVKRRWLPWRPRLREGALDLGGQVGDVVDGPLLLFVLGLVLVPIAVVLAVFVAEIALVAVVLVALTLARSIFIGRWPIEILRGHVLVHAESVRGWSDSRRRMVELADRIRLGDPPGPARRHRAEGPAD